MSDAFAKAVAALLEMPPAIEPPDLAAVRGIAFEETRWCDSCRRFTRQRGEPAVRKIKELDLTVNAGYIDYTCSECRSTERLTLKANGRFEREHTAAG